MKNKEMKNEEKKPRLYNYEYSAEIVGNWGGVIKARNKQEAIDKAKEDIQAEGLQSVGEIDVYRY